MKYAVVFVLGRYVVTPVDNAQAESMKQRGITVLDEPRPAWAIARRKNAELHKPLCAD